MRAVYVEWDDSTAYRRGWMDEDHAKKMHEGPDRVRTVGWVVQEKKGSILISPSHIAKTKRRQNSSVDFCLVIPRAAITKMVTVYEDS